MCWKGMWHEVSTTYVVIPSSASQSVDGKGLHLNKGQSMTTQVRPEGRHV